MPIYCEAMYKPLRWTLALSACLVTAALVWPQSGDDPLDSLKVCADTQELILENQFVRVIDDRIPPGVTEPMHRHRHGVVVYLNSYTNEQTTAEGVKTAQQRKAGTATWADAVVHTVKNTDKTASHAIRIELKF
jgi:hypothetical protein